MAEILKFDGDIFWNESDTENNIDDPDEELDNVGPGCVVEFEQAYRLPNFFGVMTIGPDDESIYRYFTTEKEALNASADSMKEDGRD